MGPNMFDMIKQAQALQSKMKAFQDEMEKAEFSGTAGGGAVTVVVNGKHEVRRVVISPQAVTSGAEMLQDLVKAAINDAGRKATEAMKDGMGRMTGGLSLPGLF